MKPLEVVFDVGGLMERSPQFMGHGGFYTTGISLLKAFSQDPRIRVSLFAELPHVHIKAFAAQHLKEGSYGIHGNFAWTLMLRHRIACGKLRRAKASGHLGKQIDWMIKRMLFSAACRLFHVTNARAFDGIEVWFSPIHQPPREVVELGQIKKFIMLHDMIPLVADVPDETKIYGHRDHWHSRLVQGINTNDYYFADSDYTKCDVLKYVKTVDPAKIRVTYLACSEKFVPCREPADLIYKKYGIPAGMRYVFSLCTIDPRKNLIRATKVFVEFIRKHNIKDLVLVLGGSSFAYFKEQFDREVAECGELASRIIQTGFVDEADLPAFYSHAEWFVYTSQYEGFGLPPLEAMACGCPVVASNATSLPEVVGDAGLMVDWQSDEQHLKAYETYYFDPETRAQMARRGLERAKTFSWKRCADEMIETFIGVTKQS